MENTKKKKAQIYILTIIDELFKQLLQPVHKQCRWFHFCSVRKKKKSALLICTHKRVCTYTCVNNIKTHETNKEGGQNTSPISITCPLKPPAKILQLQVRRGVTSVRNTQRVHQSWNHLNFTFTFSFFPLIFEAEMTCHYAVMLQILHRPQHPFSEFIQMGSALLWPSQFLHSWSFLNQFSLS